MRLIMLSLSSKWWEEENDVGEWREVDCRSVKNDMRLLPERFREEEKEVSLKSPPMMNSRKQLRILGVGDSCSSSILIFHLRMRSMFFFSSWDVKCISGRGVIVLSMSIGVLLSLLECVICCSFAFGGLLLCGLLSMCLELDEILFSSSLCGISCLDVSSFSLVFVFM